VGRAGRVGSEEQHYDLGLKPVRHSPDPLTRSVLIAPLEFGRARGKPAHLFEVAEIEEETINHAAN